MHKDLDIREDYRREYLDRDIRRRERVPMDRAAKAIWAVLVLLCWAAVGAAVYWVTR